MPICARPVWPQIPSSRSASAPDTSAAGRAWLKTKNPDFVARHVTRFRQVSFRAEELHQDHPDRFGSRSRLRLIGDESIKCAERHRLDALTRSIISPFPVAGRPGPFLFFGCICSFRDGITISKMITQISCSCEGQGDTQCQFANALGKQAGAQRKAWLVDYVDQHGKRHIKTLPDEEGGGRLSCQRSDRRQPWHAYA